MLAVWISIFGCQSTSKSTDSAVISMIPVFNGDRTFDFPQRSDEWWQEEDERTHVMAGAGMLVGDLNGDEQLDLVHLRRTGVHIHIRQGDEWLSDSFQELDFLASSGALLDWDQDGDVDIFLNTVFGPDVIWIREGNAWSSELLDSPIYSGGNAWYDVNSDGLLDFVSAGYGNDQTEDLLEAFQSNTPYPGEDNFYYEQSEDGQFVAQQNFDNVEYTGFTFMPIFLPFLQGERWDLLLINDFGQINGGHQLLKIVDDGFQTIPEGHGLDVAMHGMGVDATDLNDDKIPDLFITDIDRPMLLTSSGDGIWAQSALAYGFELQADQEVCWGVDWYDVNNDGHEDVWIGCGPLVYADGEESDSPLEQPDALFLWTAEGFVDVASEWGVAVETSTRGGGFVDLNDDGCAELIRVARNGPSEIFVGDCPEQNAWLDIELNDENAGVGATIVVSDGDREQIRWMRAGGTSIAMFLPQRVHFGFGNMQSLNVDVEVTWNDGTVSQFLDVSTNQRVTLGKD